jgi:hypothetical protein
MIVQHSEHEFYVSFFEMQPPIILGTPKDQQTQLEEIGHIEAECVARLVISPDRLENFIQALQTNLERYRTREEDNE